MATTTRKSIGVNMSEEPKNKGGRPPKPESERRPKINFNISPENKIKLEEKREIAKIENRKIGPTQIINEALEQYFSNELEEENEKLKGILKEFFDFFVSKKNILKSSITPEEIELIRKVQGVLKND